VAVCDHERILTLFASRRSADRSQAIADAYADPHADSLLSDMLERSKDTTFDKVVIAAYLGDLRGDDGVAVLRRTADTVGPGSRDLRCASVLALAKRCGRDATPWLRYALASSDGAVKDYAIIGLAGAGDDDAWDEVFGQLRALLRRRRRAQGQSEVAMAIAYLAQHLDDAARRRTLVEFIRKHWVTIKEAEWFDAHWPEARPEGPAADLVGAPDAERIRAWAREPLFTPLCPLRP